MIYPNRSRAREGQTHQRKLGIGGGVIVLGARMAGLSDSLESRMREALLISVVEDDWFFRDSMRSLLKSLGYTVEAFSSAADFLASPHLIETRSAYIPHDEVLTAQPHRMAGSGDFDEMR